MHRYIVLLAAALQLGAQDSNASRQKGQSSEPQDSSSSGSGARIRWTSPVKFERCDTSLRNCTPDLVRRGLLRTFRLSGEDIDARWPSSDGWCLAGFRVFRSVSQEPLEASRPSSEAAAPTTFADDECAVVLEDGRKAGLGFATASVRIRKSGVDVLVALHADRAPDKDRKLHWVAQVLVVDDEGATRVASLDIPVSVTRGFADAPDVRWNQASTDAWFRDPGALVTVWSWNGATPGLSEWRHQILGMPRKGVIAPETPVPLSEWPGPVIGLAVTRVPSK